MAFLKQNESYENTLRGVYGGWAARRWPGKLMGNYWPFPACRPCKMKIECTCHISKPARILWWRLSRCGCSILIWIILANTNIDYDIMQWYTYSYSIDIQFVLFCYRNAKLRIKNPKPHLQITIPAFHTLITHTKSPTHCQQSIHHCADIASTDTHVDFSTIVAGVATGLSQNWQAAGGVPAQD